MRLYLKGGAARDVEDLDEVMGTPLVTKIDYRRSNLSNEIKKLLYASLLDPADY